MKKTVLLAILDGWGIDKKSDKNAVTIANMEFVEQLKNQYPWVEAHASGTWVGLPNNQMGNSEVGHIHLGAGRIKYESLSLINKAIKNNEFEKNFEILNAINFAKKNNSNLHLMGLFSDGGVHSHMDHMIEIIKVAAKNNLKNVYCHLFGDGRDTKPQVIKEYIKQLEQVFKQTNVGQIASISGRYYAMDRDKRFDRISISYDILTRQKSRNSFTNIYDYIDSEYNKGKDDEMLTPAFNSKNNGSINKNDAVIFTNFRPDRAIQMSSIFTNKDYIGWKDESFKNFQFIGSDIYFVCMMKYSDSVLTNHIAFKQIEVINGLGEWICKKGMKQLRIAETEKIAHVTFFFDGGKDYFKNGLAQPNEIKLKNADIALIASPKVKSYDLKPEMSAVEITNELLNRIKSQQYDLIVLNFANCDMVGHTGDLNATIKAVKTLDKQLERIYNVSKENNCTMIITSDHGNAEIMIDSEGLINKKHTSQPVPIIITDKKIKLRKKDAAIADVAPTICDLLNIEKPSEMTQPSLIEK